MGTDYQPAIDANDHAQRKVLLWVLVLNAGLGVTLLIGGLASDSSSLIANSLDNFSDAVAYAVSFLAVTRGARWKAAAAAITGVMLLLLAGGVIVDALRRFVSGSEPLGMSMMMLAAVAVAINVLCVKLLRSHRGEDVNLRAAWTMSLNDFVSNFGIFAAGGLVLVVGSNWPDLAVAFCIALVAVYGGISTLRDAAQTQRAASSNKGHAHD